MARKKAKTRERTAPASRQGLAARPRTISARPALSIVGLVALIAATGALWWVHRSHYAPPSAHPDGPAAFVDEAGCASCHAAEHDAWTGSHHDLAMQEASASTVLADFSGTTFVHAGSKSRFLKRDGRFWIEAAGPDGRQADFAVKYTFGVDPLQQYLLELPGGRLQAYTVAWDVERKRWFDLYPKERIDFRDELHWTKPAQNWNYMCAECHSTDVHKRFDAAGNAYKTTFARINVGCQACHGPGSRHLQWAEQHSARAERAADMGLAVDLAGRDASVQIETCARCHSRRTLFWGDYRYGERLMDTHLPALLEPGLYHADGQILGEVYEYGSFLQSRMYAKGVRCSDCHDPHTAKIRARGNALCATCHNASSPRARDSIDTAGLKHKDYDSPAHHFHKPGTPGSQCVNCHMASRTYMVIDPRRDHSLRIPRPDLSVKLGTPNACNLCHADKTPGWAAEAIARWYGPSRRQERPFGEALWAGHTRQAGALNLLVTLARDGAQPDIARATALQLLQLYPGEAANQAFGDALSHSDPLIRHAALDGMEALPSAQRGTLVGPLLRDPVRAVRIGAARLLAPMAGQLDAALRPEFDAALSEYVDAQRENADRPEGHLNLGGLYARLNKPDRAEAEYRKAIELDPGFVPAYANLADLQRATASEAETERTLRAGLRVSPKSAPLHHVLGLSLVRQKRAKEALAELALAAEAMPDDPRYAYVYGVALHDLGKPRESTSVLEAAVARHPGDRDLLTALAAYARDRGDARAAARYAERLRALEGATR